MTCPLQTPALFAVSLIALLGLLVFMPSAALFFSGLAAAGGLLAWR